MALTKFAVIGAGAWGTALAQTLCLAGREAVLWARNHELADEINTVHRNSAYLPGVPLDERISAGTDLAFARGRDAVFLVTPAQHLRAITLSLAPHLSPGTPVIICSKGFEQATGKRMTEVLAETMPQCVPAVLSGPSFAADVVRGLPCAVTIACADEHLGRDLAAAIGHPVFRPYWTSDVLGVEIGGAVKNVLAIAAGIVDGRGLGASAHAALVTRGFAELMRFARALGARSETLMGLSGLGDLLLTCGSPASRNMSLGRGLGQGRSLNDILGERRTVSEGVYTARAVVELAERAGIEMPISAAVHAVVAGSMSVDAAIEALLSRPFRQES